MVGVYGVSMEANNATMSEALIDDLNEMTLVLGASEKPVANRDDRDVMALVHNVADKDDVFELMTLAQKHGCLLEKGTKDRDGNRRMYFVEQ